MGRHNLRPIRFEPLLRDLRKLRRIHQEPTMQQIRKSEERGRAEHGWLSSRHSFSFAEYQDANHIAFGPLRVINEDKVLGGQGFGTHGHQDMEIISYVLDGALEHRDSMGNGSVL